VINLVVPIAAHELDYRYALSAVPFAVLALGLALARKPASGEAAPGERAPAGAAGAAPGEAAGADTAVG
jgi:hypothetical protein